MPLGLKNSLSIQKLTTPGIVTDNLVLKHKYDAGSVIPVSDGAAYFDGTTAASNSITTTLAGNTAFSGNFTMSAWIKRLSNSEYQKVFFATDSTNDRVELYFKNDPSEASLILVIAPLIGLLRISTFGVLYFFLIVNNQTDQFRLLAISFNSLSYF